MDAERARTSDVGSGAFEPWPDALVHVEWGPTGARLAAARGDVVVIVDVLAFSTSVALAVGRGATVLVRSAAELDAMGGRDVAAATLHADVVSRDRAAAAGQVSLSPASLTSVAPGDRLLFTSLNGAACTSAATAAPLVVVGALVNRSTVAAALRRLLLEGRAARCTLVACGEHWSSVAAGGDGLRPSIEDLIGVGAIADHLDDLALSEECRVAVASYRSVADRVEAALLACVSGRELVDRGFPDDVRIAADVDATDAVPAWVTGAADRELRPLADVGG